MTAQLTRGDREVRRGHHPAEHLLGAGAVLLVGQQQGDLGLFLIQWLAILGICRWGPSLLLSSYGGVLADRYQRVNVMVVSALASAALMAGMAAVVATAAPVGFVLAITALSSAAGAPYQPAACCC